MGIYSPIAGLFKRKNAADYHTCGTASKNASTLVGRQTTRTGVSAVIHLLMIYLPYFPAKWLENGRAKNISEEVPGLVSWNVLASYPLACLLKSLLARGIRQGWQVGGSQPATALKFPKRHFLGWLIKLCVLAYRSFPGFKEEREKGMEAKAKEWNRRGKKSKTYGGDSQMHLCVKKGINHA